MYEYSERRSVVFTDEGQKMFLSIRDRSKRLLRDGGAFTMSAVISGESGVSWDMLACVDRLVELGEIREVTAPGSVAGQNRVFIKAE